MVKRTIKTLQNLIINNLKDEIALTESIKRACRVMSFTIHTGVKVNPSELHHGRKPETDLTNIVKDNKSLKRLEIIERFSTTEKNPTHIARNEKRDVTDHIIMARKKETLRFL